MRQDVVWFMLHCGSRGVGNAIGTMFIELAKKDTDAQPGQPAQRDLAYFQEGSKHFDDYVRAVGWAQEFARLNREVMMRRVIEAAKSVIAQALPEPRGSGELSPQLRAEGKPLRAERVTSPARAR